MGAVVLGLLPIAISASASAQGSAPTSTTPTTTAVRAAPRPQPSGASNNPSRANVAPATSGNGPLGGSSPITPAGTIRVELAPGETKSGGQHGAEALVPLLQTLVWPLFILTVLYVARKQLIGLASAIEKRIREGSTVKVGGESGFELSGRPFVKDTAELESKMAVSVDGNPSRLKLLFKVHSDRFQKSTKALEVPGGCVVQVSTELVNPDGSRSVAEAVAFVPGVAVETDADGVGHYLRPGSGASSPGAVGTPATVGSAASREPNLGTPAQPSRS